MARRSGPLPDGHPLKGGLILFGSGIPEAWKEGFRRKKMREQAREQAEIPEQTTDNLPDDLEVQAFQDYEHALSRSLEEKVKELPSTKPDLSQFELEARESYESAMWDQYEQATGNKRPEGAPKIPEQDGE